VKMTEAAWAAGFFDGEGSTTCCKHEARKQAIYFRVACQIDQLHPYVLRRFQRAVGVGKVRGPYGLKKVYKWSVCAFSEVIAVLGVLEPYLSPVKQRQFKHAIKKMQQYRKGAHARHVAAGKIAAEARWHSGSE
jgi:hypothetical protein